MSSLNDHTVVVAGGTGNVGSFLVRALLERGATVAVPSRSEQNLQALRTHLATAIDDANLDRLHTFAGNIGDEAGADALQQQIASEIGAPDAVIASLGRFRPAPSLLEASVDDLQHVIRDYLVAHFVVARTFLPGLKAHGGAYVFVNGPLALEPWEGSGAGLVSTVTAGQQMLFRALAQELDDSAVRVIELISHAFLREKETQPNSPLPGEAVGAYAAYLVSEAARALHGQSIQLRSTEQLEEAGLALDAA